MVGLKLQTTGSLASRRGALTYSSKELERFGLDWTDQTQTQDLLGWDSGSGRFDTVDGPGQNHHRVSHPMKAASKFHSAQMSKIHVTWLVLTRFVVAEHRRDL